MAESGKPALGLLMHYLVLVGDVTFTDVLKVFGIPKEERDAWIRRPEKAMADCYAQGRGKRFRANDRTWEWVASHFGEGLDRGSPKTRLLLLESLAQAVRRLADGGLLRVADLSGKESEQNPATETVEQAVERAYLEVTGGRYNERALLKDLRARLGQQDRAQVDEALKALRRAGRVNLMQADLPGERDPEYALQDGISQLNLMYMMEGA